MELTNRRVELPWGAEALEWEGGGSQTWVIPALAKSGMESFSELYNPPALLLESQVNPYRIPTNKEQS